MVALAKKTCASYKGTLQWYQQQKWSPHGSIPVREKMFAEYSKLLELSHFLVRAFA